MKTFEQRADGDWYPACPEPLHVGLFLRKSRCECGRTFRTRAAYREHWYAVHDPSEGIGRAVQPSPSVGGVS